MASISVLVLQKKQKVKALKKRHQAKHDGSPAKPKAFKNDWSSRVIRRCMAARIFLEAEHVV